MDFISTTTMQKFPQYQFNTLTDVIPHQIWTATSDGHLDYFNQQWFDYSKCSYEESKGQGWAKAIHENDLPDLIEKWTVCLSSHKPYKVAARILKHDGSYRWHNIHALPVYNEGVLSHWIGTNTDIHDQKCLEEKLLLSSTNLETAYEKERLSNQALEEQIVLRIKEAVAAKADAEKQRDRLYSFLMEAPVGIVILDGPTLIYELVNPRYQQLFPGRKFLLKPLYEAMPEIIGSPIADIIDNVYRTGETFEGKEFLISLSRSDDAPPEDTYWNFIYQARRNEKNVVDGVLVFAIDVTDFVVSRKKVEDSRKTIEVISEKLFLSNSKLENLNDELQIANEDLNASNEELQAANEEINVTNEELRSANEKLGQVNSELDGFIYTASHDLKAPILNIEGLVHALKGSLPVSMEDGSIIYQLIEFIEGSVKRFNQTIEDLTSVAKIQKEDFSYTTIISLRDVIDEVLLDLEYMVKKSEPLIDFDPACSIVTFSRKNLRSIVYNLISNAIKYRHPERRPRISINCRVEDHYHIISISDNGMGMNLKRDNKLFKMFGRLHHHVDGTGVGLHMVKKIIENSGGKIEVRSEVNVGSTFEVFIPSMEEAHFQ